MLVFVEGTSFLFKIIQILKFIQMLQMRIIQINFKKYLRHLNNNL